MHHPPSQARLRSKSNGWHEGTLQRCSQLPMSHIGNASKDNQAEQKMAGQKEFRRSVCIVAGEAGLSTGEAGLSRGVAALNPGLTLYDSPEILLAQ